MCGEATRILTYFKAPLAHTHTHTHTHTERQEDTHTQAEGPHTHRESGTGSAELKFWQRQQLQLVDDDGSCRK